MLTQDIGITTTAWTRLVNAGVSFTASSGVPFRYAEVATDIAPTGTVGHYVPASGGGYGLISEVTRGGFIFVRAATKDGVIALSS